MLPFFWPLLECSPDSVSYSLPKVPIPMLTDHAPQSKFAIEFSAKGLVAGEEYPLALHPEGFSPPVVALVEM